MSEASGSTTIVGNPAPAPAPAPTAGAPAPAPAASDWTSSMPDDVRGVIQTKGWKTPADAIGSYVNLEKLMGADKAGRGVIVPRDDAPAEEWAAFHNRLGRPEKADGYQLPVPEGSNAELAKAAAGKFHELGLSQKQAEALTSWWNEQGSGALQAQQAEYEQRSAIDMQDLQKEWGPQFEAQAELARRARREAGLSDEEGVAIERALGLKKAAQVFAKLGKPFAEAAMKGGEGATRGSFGATPEDARARIDALKKDAGWTAKYLSGDVDAKEEFNRLHRIAYPESA